MVDQRTRARVSAQVAARLLVAGQELAGVVEDVSPRGLFLRTGHSAAVGAEGRIVLGLPDGELELVVRVVRVAASPRCGVAVVVVGVSRSLANFVMRCHAEAARRAAE